MGEFVAVLPDDVTITGDCIQGDLPVVAVGEIEAGETQNCTFDNEYEDENSD